MKKVKETKEYVIFKKKSGRYGVRGRNKTWFVGEEKIKILLKEGLINAPVKKAVAEKTETPSSEAAVAEEETSVAAD